jgi:uncharacterized iron-regulated membrane protein
VRKPWLGPLVSLHRYVGLGLALVYFIVVVSGGVIVYRPELDKLLSPALYRAQRPEVERSNLGQVVQAALTATDGQYRAAMLSFGPTSNAPVVVSLQRGAEPDPAHPPNVDVFVDSTTGTVNGLRSGVWLDTVYALHVDLLAGRTGELLVGAAGILLVGSALTGIYMWWPGAGRWLGSLRPRWRLSGRRLNAHLHTVIGVWASGLLILISLSGVYLVFFGPVRAAVGSVVALVSFPEDPRSAPPAGPSASLGPDDALKIALERFPDGRPSYILLPLETDDVFRVKLHRPGQRRADGDTSIWIDRHNGTVLAVRDPATYTPAEHFLSLMRPIHTGEVLGAGGRIIAVLLAAATTFVVIAGAVIWLQRKGWRSFNGT